MLILHSVDEKYGVCQLVQGLRRELHHSACSLCEHCIHFNSLCVKLNEFGFFASLVIVLGNKTRGKGITFPHLNFKCIKSLKQTKQKWLLKFIGEGDVRFEFPWRIFGLLWILPNQECHVRLFLWLYPGKPRITQSSWRAKVRIFSSMKQGFTDVPWGTRPCAWHWGLRRWSRHRHRVHPGEMKWFRRNSRRGMEEHFRKGN